MTGIGWLHVLPLFLYSHVQTPAATSEITWMSPRYPCDVSNTTSGVFFNCKEQHLHDVPSGITANVTKLDLSENLIASISRRSFSELQSLKRLNLNFANKKQKVSIGEKTFYNLTSLFVLKLSGIGLQDFPTHLPPSLEILELNMNNITSVRTNSLPWLENITDIYLSKNCYSWRPCGKLTTIEENSFVNMTKLKNLVLGFNNLTVVPKGLPGSLLNLSLQSNQIQSISDTDFSGLTQLKILEIQGNCPRCLNAPFPCQPCQNSSLAIHPDAFKFLSQLEILNLGGNSLEHLHPSWFEHLTKLRQLHMSFNFLLNVIIGKAPFMRNLSHVEVLDLSFNYALKIYPTNVTLSPDFAFLTSLKTLHIEALVFQNIEKDTFKPLYQLQNLTALNLGTNFIIHSDQDSFKQFQHLRMLYLAENRLYPVPSHRKLYLQREYDQSLDLPVSFNMKHNEGFSYELTHGYIKQECFDSGNVLVLSSNNLFFISPAQFEGYQNISCLNLSKNGFSAALNGTEFSSVPNLTYLDLSFNKIDLAYDRAFRELKKLEVLDISSNEHYFKAFGITKNLNFLKNLPVLRVLNMSNNCISKLTTKQMHSTSLAELRFSANLLGKLWKKNDRSYDRLFTNLTNLTILDISNNHISDIPKWIYQYLPHTLSMLCISHNQLKNFRWEELNLFYQIKHLDLSFNNLDNVRGINANISSTLTFLDLRHNNIIHLHPGFIKGLKTLSILDLSANKLSLVQELPFSRDNDDAPMTLYLWKNPLQCTCDSLELILWLEKSNMKIPGLTTEVTCSTPENQKNHALINFEIGQCVNDSQAFLMYIFTLALTIVFMFVAVISHLYYWDASYFLHFVKARLKGYKSLNSQNCSYDLFVTYDTKDPHVSEWVMKNLRVKLEEEGEKHVPLCLEERDWSPGVPLVDNLAQSIQYSRKTLFVLTEGYIRTGIFRLATYLAHQRLLDENVDVIVLLMLEPVLQHSHFLRLRRRLCGESVIEWPKTAAAEPWFWQKLRNVVRTDNQAMYSKKYKWYFMND